MRTDRRTVVRTSPATARTDAGPTPPAATAPPGPAAAGPRWLGAGLAVGAATYGVGWILTAAAVLPDTSTVNLLGVVFQLGVFCLLASMWRTAATGTGRVARGLLVVEAVLLGLATVQSAATLPALGGEEGVLAAALNVFWPLSMVGTAVIAVRVAVAGRWRGVWRAWPCVAASWFFVALPSSALGPEIGFAIGGAHLVLGYGVLGLLLALRPDPTARLT